MTAGRVIIELFSPHSFFLNARFGPYHLGLEYQANVEVGGWVPSTYGPSVAMPNACAIWDWSLVRPKKA